MLIAGQTPWHLWGNLQTITKVPDLAEVTVPSQQLVKISYGRPETWHFVFSTRVLSFEGFAAPSSGVITIAWDLTLGHGRSATTIKSFVTHQIQWIVGFPPEQSNVFGDPLQLVSTQSTGIRSVFVDALGNETRTGDPITQIVAQEIQLQARVAMNLTVPLAATAKLEISAYFAPKTHVRPDWFLRTKQMSEQFPGGEIGGR